MAEYVKKYAEGDLIEDAGELLAYLDTNQFVFYKHRIMHVSYLTAMQFAWVISVMRAKLISEAVKVR